MRDLSSRLIEVRPKLASVRRCCVKQKRGVDETASFNTKLSGKGEVCFQDETISIRSEVADRRKVIEIGVFCQRFDELSLGHTQLFVLHLQLD